jgi:hypothetical protein
LQGRRVFVSDGGGLAITVAREPGQRQRKRLPATIPLDLSEVTDTPYEVILGHTKRGVVTLDLAEGNRAILTGGTSGSGKTNLMQSIVLQLAAKHTPAEVQIAIVDTKQVDFGQDWGGLPHLFEPVAHDLEAAACLIERVEAERLRRQALMARAGVADWREMPEGDKLPLLLLAVDEAADFARTPAMETLVEIARKGRAMGISIILGTQSPSSKVIDPQIRANLPTAIAFQTRTDIESRVILGRKGAEELNRPGLALTFIDGRWQMVQTLRVEPETTQVLVSQLAAPRLPVLDDVEADLVRYAVERLDGAFIINQLYEVFSDRISKRQLTKLGQQWESRGWLTPPANRSDPRRVTDELVGLALGRENGDTVTRVTRGDTAPEVVTRGTSQDDTLELPPFLAQRGARVMQGLQRSKL